MVLFFALIIVYQYYQNIQLKKHHNKKILQLQDVLNELTSKNELLLNKVHITEKYKADYKADLKIIANEIVNLQKVFIDIISNKNYK